MRPQVCPVPLLRPSGPRCAEDLPLVRERSISWPTAPVDSALARGREIPLREIPWREIPWWLWWNVLSIDAPLVAVVWAGLFARVHGGRISGVEAGVLVLVVWVIYTCDRLLDGWTAAGGAALKERHVFCGRHRVALASLVMTACAMIFYLAAYHLPAVEARAGIRLGVILALYMASIHVGRGRSAWVLPKEIVVGVLFAAGAALPCWSRYAGIPRGAALPFLFFALLCSLNCLSIECWENRGGGAARERRNGLAGWAASRMSWSAVVLAVAALLAGTFSGVAGIFSYELLAVSLGALLLLLLNCGSEKLSPAALRVLADAALVLPAVLALAVLGSGT